MPQTALQPPLHTFVNPLPLMVLVKVNEVNRKFAPIVCVVRHIQARTLENHPSVTHESQNQLFQSLNQLIQQIHMNLLPIKQEKPQMSVQLLFTDLLTIVFWQKYFLSVFSQTWPELSHWQPIDPESVGTRCRCFGLTLTGPFLTILYAQFYVHDVWVLKTVCQVFKFYEFLVVLVFSPRVYMLDPLFSLRRCAYAW